MVVDGICGGELVNCDLRGGEVYQILIHSNSITSIIKKFKSIQSF